MSVKDDGPPPRLHVVDEPPHDPEHDTGPPRRNRAAEMSLLGTLLCAGKLAATVRDELDASDFDIPIHETVWQAVHAVADAGVTPDMGTVLAHLQDRQLLSRDLTGDYLHTLVTTAPSTTTQTQAQAYTKTIRDCARIRAADQVTRRLRQLITNATPDTVDDALAQAVDTLDQAAGRFGPAIPTADPTGLHDLSWVTSGQAPEIPPPTWVRRTDGHALFYSGRVNGIYGDPEAAKTWLAQIAVVEALNNGQTAAMVDVDHNGADHTAARLLLLGARPEHLADPDRFRYYEPEDGAELRAAVTDITARAPAVVLLDSIGEMLPMIGVKSTDNDEITGAMRLLTSPPARAGSCVITIDHLPKSAEARATGFAIGGTAKKRAIDGAYLHAEARSQPAPGQVGRITLRVEKDRAGELRKTCSGKYVGTFTLDSTRPHTTTYSIGRDDSPVTADGVFRPTRYMEAVSRFVEDYGSDPSKAQIEKGVRGGAKHIRAAIDRLVEEAYLTSLKGLRGDVYHSTVHYREDEDDQAQ